MSEERTRALDEIFDGAARERTAADAVALAREALDGLVETLGVGHALGTDYASERRREADAGIRRAGINTGRAAVDGMRGMIASGSVTAAVMPRRRGAESEYPPSSGAWLTAPEQYAALQLVASTMRERIVQLDAQPNQLFRHLAKVVALGADAAAWTAWTL